jgi:hypothetical protein
LKTKIFTKILFICLCANLLAAQSLSIPKSEAEAEKENVTAAKLLNACSRMIPLEPLVLKGKMIVRKERGIVLATHPFQLMTDWGANPPSAECLLLDPAGTADVERVVLKRPSDGAADIRLYKGLEKKDFSPVSYAGRIRGTDMTWLDLTLDFLWWKDVRFDNKPQGECRLGRKCYILVVVPPYPVAGCSGMRIWVDKQMKCIMQAEQLNPQGDTVRRMWVQRVKKMDDRWMIRHMEIETLGSGHRTKLLVDDVATP